MDNKAKTEYKTKQREIVLDYFRINSQKQFTVNEIASAICSTDRIGKSTVYRLVSKLCSDGLIKRFSDSGNHVSVYQYVDKEHGCAEHFHLRCTNCGKIIHLEDKSSEKALLDILDKNGFELDEGQTMLYGKCKTCIEVNE